MNGKRVPRRGWIPAELNQMPSAFRSAKKMFWQLVLQIVLIACNAVFACAEIAVLSVGSMLLSVLTSLWSGLMGIGYQNYCRRVVRLDQPKMSALFSGFPMIGKAILTRFLVWVFSTLWTLLFCVGLVLVVLLGSVFIEKAAAVSVILWVVGYAAFIVLEFWLALRYSMTN